MLKVLKFLHISTKGINFALPKGGRGLACGFGRGAKKNCSMPLAPSNPLKN